MSGQYQPPSGPPPGWRGGQQQYAPPPGPPPGRQAQQYDPPAGPPPSHHTSRFHPNNPYYQPPPGPPPSHSGQAELYAPPAGPPPSKTQSQETYAPPPGPPPSYVHKGQQESYNPPPGPPPSKSSATAAKPPAYQQHDWTVVPDTALLPPPPSLLHDYSPTANATLAEGDAADAWCKAHALYLPRQPAPSHLEAVKRAAIPLIRPPEFTGQVQTAPNSVGRCRITSRAGQRDCCFISGLPKFFSLTDNPNVTEVPITIYYEIRILGIGRGGRAKSFADADAGVAIGFVAQPYPSWRLSGWQRGSLGIHGDDGRRFVNDTFGGVDFCAPFGPGDTIGLGMTFSLPRDINDAPPAYDERGQARMKLDIHCMMTRNGKKEGTWNLHEEMDERQEGGTVGLEGECDVFAAIGGFGEFDVEVLMSRTDWKYHP